METVTIGPASSWGSLQWEHAALDAPGESLQVAVIGQRESMPDTLLYVLENETETSLSALSAEGLSVFEIAGFGLGYGATEYARDRETAGFVRTITRRRDAPCSRSVVS
jgi:hypothetical protein